MFYTVLGLVFISLILFLCSIFKISGECSKQEEERNRKER